MTHSNRAPRRVDREIRSFDTRLSLVFSVAFCPDGQASLTDAQDSLAKQIRALTFSGTHFPKDFANDRCGWWPAAPANAMLSKKAFNNGYYVELYLVKEKEHLVLYIKYFTI